MTDTWHSRPLTDDEKQRLSNIEARIREITELRADTNKKILELDAELQKLSARVTGKYLPRGEFSSIVARQAKIKADLCKLRSRMAESRPELSSLSNERDAIMRQVRSEGRLQVIAAERELDAAAGMVTALAALQKQYEDFSRDATRVGSMRHMAADIARELGSIIRLSGSHK